MTNTYNWTHKRTKTLGLHEWTINDTILCYFYTKYGISSLYLNTDERLSDFIGCPVVSLIKQSMNFRTLMGFTTNVLSDYSKLQKDVYELLKDCHFNEIFPVVRDIIGQDHYERKRLFEKQGKSFTDHWRITNVRSSF